MKARLMKYAASTRPTVMKNGVNSRPWASGCRAMPEIRALPAMPSPMPAPIAPPPMIRPPPISAPAVMRAFASIPISSLIAGGGATRTTGHPCRAGLLVVLFFVFVVQFHRLAEVQDRQQGEDERLNQTDEEV